ncbi:MAG TPA: CHASE2 domain-containing protein [Polyangia bacterium]|nr:CHASE2 domain-containing protein [Polyangia bacterium]
MVDPASIESVRLRAFDVLERLWPRPADLPPEPANGAGPAGPAGAAGRAGAVFDPVAIVAIDEASIRRFGQWPWPRDLMADLLHKIAAQEPAVVGIDVLFSERDRLSPEQLAARRQDLSQETRASLLRATPNDTLLAREFEAVPVVLGLAGILTGRPNPDALDGLRRHAVQGPTAAVLQRLPAFDDVLRNLGEIERAASGHGALAVTPEIDGVARRVPLLIRIGDVVVPTLALEMLRVAADAEVVLEGGGRGVRAVSVGPFRVPTGADGRMWVPYSRHEDWRFLSAADVLEGKLRPGALADRLVLVGSTAVGLGDVLATPVEPAMLGIEIHAQMLEAILASNPAAVGDPERPARPILHRPARMLWLELGLVAAVGGLLLWLLPGRSPRVGVLLVAAVGLLLGVGAVLVYRRLQLLVDPTYPTLAALGLWPLALGFDLASLERARRRLAAELEEERTRALRLEGELAAARKIQMGILPQKFPAFPGRRDFDLHALIRPARAVGGDLYDYFLLEEHRLFFMIGDVSGKGVPASLFMALTKVLCKSTALRRQVSVADILTEANREISRDNPEALFVTVFAGILDVRTGELEFSNAGHEHPFLLRPGRTAEPIAMEGGPPVCVIEDYVYTAERMRLEEGECLLLFTDGVTEAMNGAKEMYTQARIAPALGTVEAPIVPAQVISRLYEDVQRFVAGADPSDDIAILALTRRAPAQA